jgi:hypothetical protein
LAEYFAEFDPDAEIELPQPICHLRWRSAPWDDIIRDEEWDEEQVQQQTEEEYSDSEVEEIDGSPLFNLLAARKPPPTHYVTVAVPTVSASPLFAPQADQWLHDLLQWGASLPPPAQGPRVFQRTQQSPLMDEVIHDLLQKQVIRQEREINAFRCFLIAKASDAARFIMDLSPWTTHYKTPHMRLYSAAEVLSTIPPHYFMIKIDLTSGFFQLRIRPDHTRFYGIYYRGVQYTLQRLPMGHPLARQYYRGLQPTSHQYCTDYTMSLWWHT